MLLKFGVDIYHLKRPLRKKLGVIDNIFKEYTEMSEAVITSTRNDLHSLESLHFDDNAIDLRSPKKPEIRGIKPLSLKEFCNLLQGGLGDDFDVVLEGNHIHVEYDPK